MQVIDWHSFFYEDIHQFLYTYYVPGTGNTKKKPLVFLLVRALRLAGKTNNICTKILSYYRNVIISEGTYRQSCSVFLGEVEDFIKAT